MRKRYVLKNKRRFATVIGILLLFMIFTGMIVNSKAMSTEQSIGKLVRVYEGDTLWGIASKYAKNTDIRVYIHRIKALNNLKDHNIYAGQKLLLPVR
jgi:hypothetical protein